MSKICLKVNDAKGNTLSISRPCGDGVSLVHTKAYEEGDRIAVEVATKGYYWIKLDETMPETLVYIDNPEVLVEVAVFPVPTGSGLVCYSPKSFYGNCHRMGARVANDEEIYSRRNLALNPFDGHNVKGMFPHASANVETRNEAVFAARNAIDGIFDNSSHGKYPYGSWGINRDPKAALTIDFGKEVEVDTVRITIRADFPHDNWWTQATLQFSDGSSEVVHLEKSALPQEFTFEKRVVTSVILTDLIQSDEESPFPALTQLEVIGKVVSFI